MGILLILIFLLIAHSTVCINLICQRYLNLMDNKLNQSQYESLILNLKRICNHYYYNKKNIIQPESIYLESDTIGSDEQKRKLWNQCGLYDDCYDCSLTDGCICTTGHCRRDESNITWHLKTKECIDSNYDSTKCPINHSFINKEYNKIIEIPPINSSMKQNAFCHWKLDRTIFV